ncbi:hypothetical protein HHK36_004393 [Tetracentron sinense]|uniref:RHOMBOID-like protein n=1 Tax=Tetracentron sinense TaxID=13715 RepID=A0A834ZQJ7_TETSI|nr:hypothetical protein HHK36_004393 [Tetracentron sinense]
MAETIKDQSRIEIKSQEPTASSDFADEFLREQRIRFFSSGFQRKENTWVISLFVVLHLVAFAATMFVNDCSSNSHGDCVLIPLGRMSFQPLSENPLLGPSSSTLDEFYTRFVALVALLFVGVINFVLGFLPLIDNFSNIGGFLSGFLLGFVLLFNPRLGQVAQNKGGLFEYNVKSYVKFKHKLDKPVLRSVSLVMLGLILAGGLVAVLHGVNANKYCSSCHYINCVPSKNWSCNDKAIPCEVYIIHHLIITCEVKGDKKKNCIYVKLSTLKDWVFTLYGYGIQNLL